MNPSVLLPLKSKDYLPNRAALDDWPRPVNLLAAGAAAVVKIGLPSILDLYGRADAEVGPALLPAILV